MTTKTFYQFLLGVIISSLLILPSGCSKNGEQQAEEKGSIEKMTDQAADTAVKRIRTPQDTARFSKHCTGIIPYLPYRQLLPDRP
jgi:hypothetical protein